MQSDEVTAEELLVLFMKCSNEKVLDLYHQFERFLEYFSRYDPLIMESCRRRLNQRRSEILGYESAFPDFYMWDRYNRTDSLNGMEQMLEESKSKLGSMHQQYKTTFMEKEILSLQQYLIKAYAKQGEDKTNDKVNAFPITNVTFKCDI